MDWLNIHFPGFVILIPALADGLFLNLPATFMQHGNINLAALYIFLVYQFDVVQIS